MWTRNKESQKFNQKVRVQVTAGNAAGMAGAGALASVRVAPKSDRSVQNEPSNGDLYILSMGPKFQYVIPSFDVLAVDIRLTKVQGQNEDGGLKVFDMFIRDDPSLDRTYPAELAIADVTCVHVSIFPCSRPDAK